jgi:hypothetical protein
VQLFKFSNLVASGNGSGEASCGSKDQNPDEWRHLGFPPNIWFQLIFKKMVSTDFQKNGFN